MSSIKASALTAESVVPLAFHVDYWDYIGWKDRFARPAFSERQRQSASISGSSFVYTPQILLNGEDFRGWQQPSRFNQAVASARQQPALARLSVTMASLSSGEIAVTTTANVLQTNDASKADLFVAVYENSLKSLVKAGENSGRELTHDYVVREWFGPYPLETKEAGVQKLFTLKAEWKGRDAGVATFVQDRKNGQLLQALGLPFCR